MSLYLGLAVLAIVSYGADARERCYENGRYYAHRESWQNTTYPDCVHYRCIDGEVYEIMKGCIHKGVCRKVGSKWSNNCTDYKCTKYRADYVTYFEVKPTMKCEYKGKCYRNRQTVRDGCDVLTCRVSHNHVNNIAVMDREGRCTFKGKRCYKHGQTWTRGCVTYKCTVKNEQHRRLKTITGVAACKFKGKCYKLGAQWQHECTTYECQRFGDKGVKPEIIKAECPWNGKCYPEGTTWDDNDECVTYVCEKKYVKQKRYSCHVKSYMKGCVMNAKCRKFGYRTTDFKCNTWECKKRGTRGSKVVHIGKGCKDFTGNCRQPGDKYDQTVSGITQRCVCKANTKKRSKSVCEIDYTKK